MSEANPNQYQIHIRVFGYWVVYLGDEQRTLSYGVRSLREAKRICVSHGGQRLRWVQVKDYLVGLPPAEFKTMIRLGASV